MSDQVGRHTLAAPSSSPSSPPRLPPDGKPDPRDSGDFKGVPVSTGSPGQAPSHGLPAVSGGNDHPLSTPLQGRQAQALTGPGEVERKREVPAAQAQAPVPVQGTKKQPATQEEVLALARSSPLKSVEDCCRVLQAAVDFGGPITMRRAACRMAKRLGGRSMQAASRDRLFEALLHVSRNTSRRNATVLMQGAATGCLPKDSSRQSVDQWLRHLREWIDKKSDARSASGWWRDPHKLLALATVAAAGGMNSQEIATYLIREVIDHTGRDFPLDCFHSVVARVGDAVGSHNQADEAIWPGLLRASIQAGLPWDWLSPRDLPTGHYVINEKEEALVRNWTLDQIRTNPLGSRRMLDLLVRLEMSHEVDEADEEDQDGLTKPEACEHLLAKLVSDPGRAKDLAGVLLAICCSYGIDEPQEWRDVLRSFVLAAAPHARPVEWVAIGMENRWFREGQGDKAVHQGFLPAELPPAAQQWLRLGASGDPSSFPTVHAGLTDAENARLMCLCLDRYEMPREGALRWMGTVATLPLAFDARMNLLAFVLESQAHALGPSDFAFARLQVVGQMIEQGPDDASAFEYGNYGNYGNYGKETKESKAVLDRKGSEQMWPASPQDALAPAHAEWALVLGTLHRAWRKGKKVEWTGIQSRPTAAWLEKNDKALRSYRQFLQDEIAKLAKTGLPAETVEAVLQSFLRPVLAEVETWLALKPVKLEGKAQPVSLDEDEAGAMPAPPIKPGPSSTSSSSSSSSPS